MDDLISFQRECLEIPAKEPRFGAEGAGGRGKVLRSWTEGESTRRVNERLHKRKQCFKPQSLRQGLYNQGEQGLSSPCSLRW